MSDTPQRYDLYRHLDTIHDEWLHERNRLLQLSAYFMLVKCAFVALYFIAAPMQQWDLWPWAGVFTVSLLGWGTVLGLTYLHYRRRFGKLADSLV